MIGFLKKIFGGDSSSEKNEIEKTTKSENISSSSNTKNKSSNPLGTPHELDCKNMNCPMPIVMISKKIKTVEIGESIEVTATDPAFIADVEAWVRKTGNEMVSYSDQNQIKIAVVKKLVEL